MKRIAAVLLLIVFLSFVLAQEVEYRKDPPKPSDFPRANNSCLTKRKLYVSVLAGVPVGSVNGSAKVSCQFTTLKCGGTPERHASIPVLGHQHVCDGWQQARDAIAGAAIEICCDEPDANQEPSSTDEKPECPSPTSWFDNSAPCKEKRAPWTAVRGNEIVVTLCGFEVFRATTPGSTERPDPLLNEAYREVVKSQIQSRIGSSVCCDKFRDAVRTGVPCNPANDVDCDGTPNSSDTYLESQVSLPDINLFSRPAGANIDPFPPGIDPDDPDFLPNRTARDSRNVGDCPCKWELIKGELKCSANRNQRHVYLATWRCPTTKAEVITTKYASAGSSCP